MIPCSGVSADMVKRGRRRKEREENHVGNFFFFLESNEIKYKSKQIRISV